MNGESLVDVETPAVAPNIPVGQVPGAHPMEIWISYVLRIGVMAAGAVILVGLVFFLVRGAGSTTSTTAEELLRGGGKVILVSPGSIFTGVAALDPIAIIQVGVLLLILTPMMRVGMTVLLFGAQRDWTFVAITCVVFSVLVAGLIGVGS